MNDRKEISHSDVMIRRVTTSDVERSMEQATNTTSTCNVGINRYIMDEKSLVWERTVRSSIGRRPVGMEKRERNAKIKTRGFLNGQDKADLSKFDYQHQESTQRA